MTDTATHVWRIYPQGGGFSRQMNLAAKLRLTYVGRGWTTSSRDHADAMRRAGAKVEAV